MIRPYIDLDWSNPNPYDVSYYYYLNEMFFERTFKNKLYMQVNLVGDGNIPEYFFGGDFTQCLISSNYMHSFFNACRWLMLYHYKTDITFSSSNFDYDFMIVKKHLKYSDRDILALLDLQSFYMPKFETYDDKIFFIKACHTMLKTCRYTSVMDANWQYFTITGISGTTAGYQSWEDCKTAFNTNTMTSINALFCKTESVWVNDMGNEYETFKLGGSNRMYFKTLYPIFRANQTVKMFLVPCNMSNYNNVNADLKMLYIDGVQTINNYSLTADSNGFLTVDVSFDLDDFYPQFRTSLSDKITKNNYFCYYPIFLIDNYSFYQYT